MASVPQPAAVEQPVFYFDLGSPECYLVAEQILTALPVVPEWEPVHGAQLVGADAVADPDWERLAMEASELGIQPLRRPEAWPPNTRNAMLAASYAKRIGRAVAFSLAAFRQAYAGGRDLGEQDTLLIAGAACEIHPAALLKGIALRSSTEALEAATSRALTAGVRSLPAIRSRDAVFTSVGDAVAAMGPR